jgi:hypothetical protein
VSSLSFWLSTRHEPVNRLNFGIRALQFSLLREGRAHDRPNVLNGNDRPHVRVNVTMIGKAARSSKSEAVGTTREDVSTIKRLTVITGDGMGHG